MIDQTQLQAVRDKISQGWVQGVPAYNKNGHLDEPDGATAVCWCIWGAAYAVGIPSTGLARVLGFESAHDMIRWNDTPGRTQEEVLRRIDNALAS